MSIHFSLFFQNLLLFDYQGLPPLGGTESGETSLWLCLACCLCVRYPWMQLLPFHRDPCQCAVGVDISIIGSYLWFYWYGYRDRWGLPMFLLISLVLLIQVTWSVRSNCDETTEVVWSVRSTWVGVGNMISEVCLTWCGSVINELYLSWYG